MSKPVWTWTHTGEQGEELAECEGKYYTRHAWDNFLAAYTGRVRPAHRDRPRAFAVAPDGEITFAFPGDPPPNTHRPSGVTIGNYWPDDEITLELP